MKIITTMLASACFSGLSACDAIDPIANRPPELVEYIKTGDDLSKEIERISNRIPVSHTEGSLRSRCLYAALKERTGDFITKSINSGNDAGSAFRSVGIRFAEAGHTGGWLRIFAESQKDKTSGACRKSDNDAINASIDHLIQSPSSASALKLREALMASGMNFGSFSDKELRILLINSLPKEMTDRNKDEFARKFVPIIFRGQ